MLSPVGFDGERRDRERWQARRPRTTPSPDRAPLRSAGDGDGRNAYPPSPVPLPDAVRTLPGGCLSTPGGLAAEEVAVLCLLVADGELEVPAGDVADLLDATERRAGASFGPTPGVLRQALAGLVMEAALARPGELAGGSVDDALDRVTLRDLIGPMLSRDRLWFTAGGVHWSPLSPASMAGAGAGPLARVLLALAASGAPPTVVNATLEQLDIDRSFIRALLEPRAAPADDELERQVSYQDWYE